MSAEETEFNPKQRRLCPDGACVGLIGDDNRCKECGAFAGTGTDPAADSGADTWDGAKDGSDDATLPRTLGDVARLDDGSTFDPARRLCSDGACLGIVGADDRCNVCGRPGE